MCSTLGPWVEPPLDHREVRDGRDNLRYSHYGGKVWIYISQSLGALSNYRQTCPQEMKVQHKTRDRPYLKLQFGPKSSGWFSLFSVHTKLALYILFFMSVFPISQPFSLRAEAVSDSSLSHTGLSIESVINICSLNGYMNKERHRSRMSWSYRARG